MDEMESSPNAEEKALAQEPVPPTEELPRVAVIPVAVEFLEAMLPPQTKILGVSQNDYSHTINVMVTHPSFDPVPKGELPPHRSLMIWKESHIGRVEYGK